MNKAVRSLVTQLNLDDDQHEKLRLEFSLACVERTRALLEDPQIVRCLDDGRRYLAGEIDQHEFATVVQICKDLAASHHGSRSIDGAGHAAVSASLGVAKALQGYSWDAAEYAAYASVYAYAGYAVTDPDAFNSEYAWQTVCLLRLIDLSNS